MAKEMWVDAKGWEDKYQVSDRANLRSKKTGETLKPLTNGDKYKYYMFYNPNKKGKNKRVKVRLHRLVAWHFVPNPYLYNEVNHKDGDKYNCLPENLEWVSKKQNSQHAVATGLHVPYFLKIRTDGENNVNSKLTWENVDEIRQRYADGDTDLYAMQEEYGVKYKTLWEVVNNKSWIRKQ